MKIAILLTVGLLAGGCGRGDPVTVLPTPPSIGTTVSAGVVDVPDFVLAFRDRFPSLALGRSDRAIRDDGISTCSDIRSGGKDGTVVRGVTMRFAPKSGHRPSERQAREIVALVRSNCR